AALITGPFVFDHRCGPSISGEKTCSTLWRNPVLCRRIAVISLLPGTLPHNRQTAALIETYAIRSRNLRRSHGPAQSAKFPAFGAGAESGRHGRRRGAEYGRRFGPAGARDELDLAVDE